jgi:pyruvate-formate lyase-activating enzyme
LLLFDYKLTDPEAHRRYTGLSNERILANLDVAYHAQVPIVLRCPVIPSVNDNEEHFTGIRALDRKYPLFQAIEIMPYHNFGVSKSASIGRPNPATEFRLATQEDKQRWLKRLQDLGCRKIRIN